MYSEDDSKFWGIFLLKKNIFYLSDYVCFTAYGDNNFINT